MNDKDLSNVTHYTHVDVQPGGINIQHVEHLHQVDVLDALGIELELKKKKDGAKVDPEALWPEVLCSNEALEIWRKLERKGFVEGEKHRLTSKTTRELAAYIGNKFADVMNIAHKWKVFERGWNVKNLGVYLNKLNNRAMSRDLKKTLSVIDDVFE